MGVVFKLQLTDLSPQLGACENDLNPPQYRKNILSSHLTGQKYANCIVSVKNPLYQVSSEIGKKTTISKNFPSLDNGHFFIEIGGRQTHHSQIFSPTIRCLLFFDLSNIFLRSLQIVFISSHYSLLTFRENFAYLSNIRY